jgi:hypothetical protein
MSNINCLDVEHNFGISTVARASIAFRICLSTCELLVVRADRRLTVTSIRDFRLSTVNIADDNGLNKRKMRMAHLVVARRRRTSTDLMRHARKHWPVFACRWSPDRSSIEQMDESNSSKFNDEKRTIDVPS